MERSRIAIRKDSFTRDGDGQEALVGKANWLRVKRVLQMRVSNAATDM